jgi:hypothetical protein
MSNWPPKILILIVTYSLVAAEEMLESIVERRLIDPITPSTWMVMQLGGEREKSGRPNSGVRLDKEHVTLHCKLRRLAVLLCYLR